MAALPDNNKSTASKPEEEKKSAMEQAPASKTGKVMVEIRQASIGDLLEIWEKKGICYKIYLFEIYVKTCTYTKYLL